MTDTNGNAHTQLRSWIIIYIICFTLAGCGADSGKPKSDTAHSGQLQLDLQWHTESAPAAERPAAPGDDVCVDFMITWIRIRVKDSAGKVVANSVLLPCDDHRASLDHIPPRSGYTVEVEGLIDNKVRWRGAVENVEVVANRSNDLIMVTMTYIGEKGKPLSATVQPADVAANISTDDAIKIKFDKAVVEASVNHKTIRVTRDNEPMAGSLTYHPETFEAVFQPAAELAVSSVYTVHVTTGVIDLGGQPMTQAFTSRFTTTTVWYVDAGVTKSGLGNSWREAFHTIAEAVKAAGNGHQIWVRQGTYKPTAQINIDKAVELLGGFEGTETQHHQRDWKTGETVVDGNGEHRCFNLTANITIDGFTIKGGAPPKTPSASGGAMLIDGASPQIINCFFLNNESIVSSS